MFTLVAATLFFVAFLMATGTIAWMFTVYHGKMIAALLFRPIPQDAPVYHIRIRRHRTPQLPYRAPLVLPVGALVA